MADTGDLVRLSEAGFHCPAGDFHVDPWRPVDRAIVTHAHADHARGGSRSYLCAEPGETVLRARLGESARIETIPYGERRRIGEATVSLHPAGHVIGSAQVRIETAGGTWVLGGDYAADGLHTAYNPTCAPFEAVPCDVFVSECTFGLPVYRWPDPAGEFAAINDWWASNRAAGRTSVLFAYALGKAQRLLAGLDPSIGPILVHGAVVRLNRACEAGGMDLPPWQHANRESAKAHRGEAIVIAPPSTAGSTWLRRFAPASTAFASGWMRVRASRRWRAADRGFVLSDHADWDGLLAAIEASGAARIGLTHGSTGPMARYLGERGLETIEFPTHFAAGPGEDDGDSSEEDGSS